MAIQERLAIGVSGMAEEADVVDTAASSCGSDISLTFSSAIVGANG